MSEQQTPQPLQAALDRLLGVQLIDNTVQDAREARQELLDIITDLYAAATRAAYEEAALIVEERDLLPDHCWLEDSGDLCDELVRAIRARAEAKSCGGLIAQSASIGEAAVTSRLANHAIGLAIEIETKEAERQLKKMAEAQKGEG